MSSSTKGGYEGKKNKLTELISPLGTDAVKQVIYCPYPDKSYLIAARHFPQQQANMIKIIVCDFTFNDDEPSDIKVGLSIIGEHTLDIEGHLYTIPSLAPLKKEKSLLVVINTNGNRELWKMDIESGYNIWKKAINFECIVEDNRGILFASTFDGYLVLMDSASGNVLNKIKLRERFHYGIGLDVNDNLILGGYDRNYLTENRVYSKNGNHITKIRSMYALFTAKVDPIKGLTYFLGSNQAGIMRFDSEYRFNFETLYFPVSATISGFFFVKNFKYLVLFTTSNLEVYD